MPGQYTYLACDLITGNVREALQLTQASFARDLNTPGPFSALMPLGGVDPLVAAARIDAVAPGRSSIVAVRDGVALGEWIVWEADADNDGSPYKLGGDYITSYLDSVRPVFSNTAGDLPEFGWTATEQLTIANALAGQAADPITISTAPPGSRGIALTIPATAPSGNAVDQTDWPAAGKYVGPMMAELASAPGGFDWDIDVTLNGNQVVRSLTLSYPRRGIDSGIVLQPAEGSPGGNVTHVATQATGRRIATQVVGVGGGQGAGQLFSYSNNTASVSVYPLLQSTYTDTTVFDPVALQKQSDALAMNSRDPLLPPQVTIRADVDPVLGSYRCGDYVTLIMGSSTNFPNGYQQKLRITSIQVNPPKAGPEVVTLGVALIPEA